MFYTNYIISILLHILFHLFHLSELAAMTGASAPLTFCIHDFEGAGQVQTMQQVRA